MHIEDAKGNILETRRAARDYFPYERRMFWWDRLDQTYFVCYALWNYLTMPALLLRSDIV